MQYNENPQAEPSAFPRATVILLAVIGFVLISLCIFPQTGILFLLGPVIGAPLVAYAVFASDFYRMYGLFPVCYIALSLIGGNWLISLPVMISFLASALLLPVCKYRMLKTGAVALTGAVLAFGYAVMFAGILYAMSGSLSVDTLREIAAKLHTVYLDTAQKMIDNLKDQVTASITMETAELAWQTAKLLIPAYAVCAALAAGWIFCSVFHLCGRVFPVHMTPEPWGITVSPVTAVLYLITALLCALFDRQTVFSITMANLNVILALLCAAVGFRSCLPTRHGPVRIIPPMLFIMIGAVLFLGVGAIRLIAFYGALVALISSWRRYMMQKNNP